MRSQLIKRAFDLAFAGVAMAVLAPFLAILALAIRLRIGTPVLFVQLRPGLGGAPFRLLKFRTMTDARDAAGQLLPDAERLTQFGAFLRRTSLDELPELWNILKGEMSLVGPRPLLMEYLPLYTPRQARRHEVRPGLTGLAQIGGRNALEWEKKFELDVWYVEHWSISLDLQILWRTVRYVLEARDITRPGHATAEKFKGSAQ